MSDLPPLPPGFVLDDDTSAFSTPPLPLGFILDTPQPEEPSTDWLDIAQRGLASGMFGIGRTAGGAVEGLGDVIARVAPNRDAESSPIRDLGEYISNFGKETRGYGDLIENTLRGDDIQPGTAESVLYGGVSGATQAIPAVMGLGPLGGAALLGAGSGVNKYGELRDRGVDQGEAAAYGAGIGVLDTGLNALPFAYYLKNNPLLKRLIFGGAIDAITSAGSAGANIEATKLATGDEWVPSDAMQIGEAGVTGVVSGMPLAGYGAIKNNLDAKRSMRDIDNIMSSLESERPKPLLGLPAPGPEGAVYGDNFTMTEPDPNLAIYPQPGEVKRPTEFREPIQIADVNPPPDPRILPEAQPQPEPRIQVETSSARTPEQLQDMSQNQAFLDYMKRNQIAYPEGTEAPRNPFAESEVIQPFTQKGTVRESLSPEEKKIVQYITSEKLPLEAPPKVPLETGVSRFDDVDAPKVDLEAESRNVLSEFGIEPNTPMTRKEWLEAQLTGDRDYLKFRAKEPTTDVEKQSRQEYLAEVKQRQVELDAINNKGVIDITPEPPRTLANEFKNRLNSESGAFRNPFAKQPGANIPVKGLTEEQSFLQGRIKAPLIGEVQIPGLGKLRETITLPKTLADKYPQVQDAYYEGGRTLIEHANETGYNLSETFRPYFQLKDSTRLDGVLSKLREDAIASKKAGKPLLQPSTTALQRAGLSAEEITAYDAFRKGTNQSLDVLREALLQDVDKVQGAKAQAQFRKDVDKFIDDKRNTMYAPMRRYGDAFEVLEKDKDGKTLYRSHHDSKAEARKVAAELIKKGRKAYINERPKSDPDAYSELSPDLVPDAQRFDPTRWTDMAEERPMEGFNRHLVNAEGIEGYDRNVRKATVDYVLGLANFAARKKALPIIDKVIAGIDPDTDPILRGQIERYKEHLTKPNAAWSSNIKSTVNAMTLAAVPSSAIINGFQTFTNTIPKIASETAKRTGLGRATPQALKIAGKALSDSTLYLSDSLRGTNKLAAKNPQLAADIKLAMKRGIIDAEGMNELFGYKKKIDGTSTLQDKAMFLFGAAEKGNRLYAFTAGREIGMRNGLKGDALFDYARKFVLDTQFDTSKANQSALTGSNMGSVATQYKMFAANQLRFLRNHTKKGDRLALALSMGVTAGLGGAMAMPFAKVFEQTAEAFGFNARKAWKKFMNDSDWAHRILYGLPTDLGINISGAVSNEIVPSLDMDPKMAALQAIGGPAVGYIAKGAKALKQYKEDDAPWIAAENIIPRSLRGPSKAIRAATDREGALRDSEGKPLMKDTSAWEKTQLALGFQPDRLGREYERRAFAYDITNKATEKTLDYNMLLARSLMEKDDAAFDKYLIEMVSKGIKPNKKAIKDHMIGHIDPDLEALVRAPKKARPELLELQELMKRR